MTELREKLNEIATEKSNKIVPENIKVGVEVFDVVGNYTSDATATAGDIAKGKTAYVNGEKLVGAMEAGTSDNNAMIKTMIGSGTSSNSGLNKAVTLINGDFTVDGTSAQYMFYNCSSLESVATLDLTNVTSCYYMFYGCSVLESISLKNTSSVTNMERMFYNCYKLKNILGLDTSGAFNTSYLFSGCDSLESIPQLNTSMSSNMQCMFYSCDILTEIPLIDTSRCTNMRQMFRSCKALVTVPQLNTSKVTDMYGIFAECTKLSDESINNILGMCANATSYSDTKTLDYIGLGSLYLTTSRIQNMSNYQAFIDAGWKIS